jgi:hypothetical protein
MARLRRLASTRGSLPARGGGVLGVGDVAHVVQCLDAPMPAQVVGQVDRACLVDGQAGGVHGDDAPAAAACLADTAGDLDRLGGVREPQGGDGGDLQGPDLDAAMGVVEGAVQHRDLPPRQPGELGVQGWLVGPDDQQVVRAAVDQEAGVVALGVHGVGGDHHPGEVQAGQQRLELRDLVAAGVDLALGQHRSIGVVHDGQQLHRPVLAAAGGAAQRLAVNGERPVASRARRAQPLSQLRADRPVQPVGVHARKDPADGGLAGDLPAAGEGVTAHPERGQDRPWRIRGPLGDRGHTAGAGQHGRGAEASTLARVWRRPRRARGSGRMASRSSRPGPSPTASGRA